MSTEEIKALQAQVSALQVQLAATKAVKFCMGKTSSNCTRCGGSGLRYAGATAGCKKCGGARVFFNPCVHGSLEPHAY